MVYTIASNQVNAIRYMKAVRTLVVGTTGGEFTVSADGTDASITPTNITIKRQSSFGSANVMLFQLVTQSCFYKSKKKN